MPLKNDLSPIFPDCAWNFKFHLKNGIPFKKTQSSAAEEAEMTHWVNDVLYM